MLTTIRCIQIKKEILKFGSEAPPPLNFYDTSFQNYRNWTCYKDLMGAGVIMPLLLSLIFFGFGFGPKTGGAGPPGTCSSINPPPPIPPC
jgi:hypothetical protein